MTTNTCYHAATGDTFEARIVKDGPPYAVVTIKEDNLLPVVNIFTPSGLNWTTDYLRELRDALNGAIAELEEMGAVKEAGR